MIDRPVGIDLGTARSRVAVVKNGKVIVLADNRGSVNIPSCVSFTDAGKVVGVGAVRQAEVNPTNTIFDIKCLMGRKFEENRHVMKHFSVKIVSDENDDPLVQIQSNGATKELSPEEISAMIITQLKEIAESFYGEKVRKAVISVPASFNNAQRLATIHAGGLAGLNVTLINAPTAAALVCAHRMKEEEEIKSNLRKSAFMQMKNQEIQEKIYLPTIELGGKFLILDFGAGACDASVVHVDGHQCNVHSTAGSSKLGGRDLDSRLVEHCLKEFELRHKKRVTCSRAIHRLRSSCEKTKIILSSSDLASIHLDDLFDGINFIIDISRSQFEAMCADLFQAALSIVKQAISHAEMDPIAVHKVILVGGSTRIPILLELLGQIFPNKKLERLDELEDAVAKGAALHSTFGDEYESIAKICPREIATYGIAIETPDGHVTEIVKRFADISAYEKVIVTTQENNQTEISLNVYEGDGTINDSNLLDRYLLSGIDPAPRGKPQIEVTVTIEESGVLNLFAEDKASGGYIRVSHELNEPKF